MATTHIWQEEASITENLIALSVTIETPAGTRKKLWYRTSLEYASLISKNLDHFVVGYILDGMSQGNDLMIHGEVSPSLLQNLTELQIIWNSWRPQKYHLVEMSAEVEKEAIKAEGDRVISSFSGGIDSCYTAWRHHRGNTGRIRRNLTSAIMVHGLDIPLEQGDIFQRALAKGHKILESLEMPLIPSETNYRYVITTDWDDVYGAAIASCLMFFQGGFTGGLVASGSSPYQKLLLPIGSNPLTDQLFRNQAFYIFHDGAGANRLQKIEGIAHWQEALENLRVCWEGKQLDRNCGRCEKCIRTILGFRVLGLPLPPCFEQDVTDRQILGIKAISPAKFAELESILARAKAEHISESWVSSLEICIQRNRLRRHLHQWKESIKEQLPTSVVEKIVEIQSRWLMANK